MPDRADTAWHSQEAARQGMGGERADRLVAQALSQPLPVDLPPGFAADMARLAQRRAAVASPAFEWALQALAAALVLLAAGFALQLDPGLVPTLARALPTQGMGGWAMWLALAAGATALGPSLLPHRQSA